MFLLLIYLLNSRQGMIYTLKSIYAFVLDLKSLFHVPLSWTLCILYWVLKIVGLIYIFL